MLLVSRIRWLLIICIFLGVKIFLTISLAKAEILADEMAVNNGVTIAEKYRDILPLPNWSLGFNFSFYQPQIASSPEVIDYYKLIFKKDPQHGKWSLSDPTLKSLVLNYYLSKDYGLWGLTTQIGYFRVSGKSRACLDPVTNEQIDCDPAHLGRSVEGTQSTDLTLIPIRAGIVYRFDWFSRRLALPLAWQVRGSLDYTFWSIHADGQLARKNGQGGYGGTLGYSAAFGLLLALNWLDPTTHYGRNIVGMLNSHLLIEIGRTFTGLQAKNRLDTADNRTLTFGLLIDFL